MRWSTIGRLRPLVLCAGVLLSSFLGGCSGQPDSSDRAEPVRRADPRPSAPVRPQVVILGDSLTAGLGLTADQAYPALLQEKINSSGLSFQVVNAGVSGDTTAGGLRRLNWVLQGDVRVLVVALGGNDALRGLPVEELHRNLTTIVQTARERGVQVLLVGMEAPPNVGREYTDAFRQAYRDVAERHDIPLIPFLLEGVAGEAAFNQRDGIHPNAAGAERLADVVWRALEPMLTGLPTS